MARPHCWKDNAEEAAERFGWGSDEWAEAFNNPASCMLEGGHDGPHDFVSDSKIGIQFGPENRNG